MAFQPQQNGRDGFGAQAEKTGAAPPGSVVGAGGPIGADQIPLQGAASFLLNALPASGRLRRLSSGSILTLGARLDG